MKSAPRIACILLLLLASVRNVAAAAPAAAEPLYIAVETFDPIQFRELQTAADRGGELVFSTIRATAAHSARLVGYPGEVRTLDEGAKAPAGAVVLRLT